jgi:hypothetical protein
MQWAHQSLNSQPSRIRIATVPQRPKPVRLALTAFLVLIAGTNLSQAGGMGGRGGSGGGMSRSGGSIHTSTAHHSPGGGGGSMRGVSAHATQGVHRTGSGYVGNVNQVHHTNPHGQPTHFPYFRTDPHSPWVSYGGMHNQNDAIRVQQYLRSLGYDTFLRAR